MALDVAGTMQIQPRRSVVPVLFIGEPQPELHIRLFEHGIGIVVARSIEHARTLLRHFTVAAVVYDALRPQLVADVIALGAPVVMLAGGNTEWHERGVTVVDRRLPAAAIADTIQRVAVLLAVEIDQPGEETATVFRSRGLESA